MAETNEKYSEKEQERIDAVDRYLKDERPSKICKNIGRSRVWLRKWIGRFKDSDIGSK